jgi:hypothetical protein
VDGVGRIFFPAEAQSWQRSAEIFDDRFGIFVRRAESHSNRKSLARDTGPIDSSLGNSGGQASLPASERERTSPEECLDFFDGMLSYSGRDCSSRLTFQFVSAFFSLWGPEHDEQER